MIDRSLTRRYVAAVHRLASEAGQVDVVRDELAAIQTALETDERLLALLRHPNIGATDKRDLLLKLAGPQPSRVLQGLVDVLLEKERPEVLLGAAEVYTELADEAAGVVRARVEVAVMPTPDQQARLQAALAKLLGRPVTTDFALAPEVLGGARVRVAGRLLDGSLSGSLSRLAAGLRAG